MQIDIRRHLDNLLSNHSLTKANADCIYQEYFRLKDDYLAGKLQKSTLRTLNKMRIEAERSRVSQKVSDLPSTEDMALFGMAKSICDKVKNA